MDKELADKIGRVEQTLREQSVDELARFDVKDGEDRRDREEDYIPYHKTYLEAAMEDMGDLFRKTEWDGLTPWEKLCCYKVSDTKGVDCDAALRSNVIFRLAFWYGDIVRAIKKEGQYLLKRGALTLRGDTMNSYATTVREYLKTYRHEEDQVKGLLEKAGNGKWGTSKYNNLKGHWEACVLDRYDYFKDILPPAAEEFFRLCHTVGNFIPAPRVFQTRGRYSWCNKAPCDYWDLALMCIYNEYHKVSDSKYTLKWLVQTEENASLCREWLDCFGQGQDGWDGFVEQNFLQEFVNQAGEHYGLPKELWEGHFAGEVLPQKKMPPQKKTDDFEQFFTNASAWITARGIRIALAVKEGLAIKEGEPEAVEAERG